MSDTPGLGISTKDPRNRQWATDSSRFGYKMLLKMGWKDGKGLGASEDGCVEAVKAHKRPDNRGIGATDTSKNWVRHTEEFARILETLNAKHGLNALDEVVEDVKKDKKKKKRKKEVEVTKIGKKKRKHATKPVLFHSHKRTRHAKDASKYGAEAFREIMGHQEQ